MDRWCAKTGAVRGEVLSLDQTWALSQAWYGDRLDPAYRGRTADQAKRVFRSVGLRSSFWSLDEID